MGAAFEIVAPPLTPRAEQQARRPCYVTRLQAKSRNKKHEVVDRAACYSVVFPAEKTRLSERWYRNKLSRGLTQG